jgi:XTP/dITP diphosphohydrolase
LTQVIFLASGNEKKLAELRTLCVDLPVDIVGPESLSHTLPEVEEDRLTFLGNAQKKALAAAQFIAEHLGPNVWALADDSGLCVDALDGNPGVFSARYSGILGAEQDSANNAHLLEQLKNTPKSKRQASFHCAIAVAQAGKVLFHTEGRVAGHILEQTDGNAGFGYDPLFYHEPSGCTFAHLSSTKKSIVSHRGQAVALLRQTLSQHLPS